jgi:hypothetical protein
MLLQCCADQPRLAVKVAQCWDLQVDHFSVEQQVQLLDHISQLLDANATSASGVSLLLHFRPLLPHFHLEAVLEDLVLSSQEPVATRLVRQLGSRPMQVLLVTHCLTYAQLRSANNVVREFGLQQVGQAQREGCGCGGCSEGTECQAWDSIAMASTAPPPCTSVACADEARCQKAGLATADAASVLHLLSVPAGVP